MPSLKDYIEKAKKKGYSKEDLTKDLIIKGYSKEEVDEAFGLKRKKFSKEKITDLNYFEKFKGLFSYPTDFFETIREKHIGNSLLLFVIVSALSLAASYVISFSFAGFFSRNFFGVFYWYPIVMFVYFIFLVVGSFVYSGISHLTAKILGGSGSFVDSYNVCTYSLVPFALFLIIPYIGWLSIVYSIILMSFGLAYYHDISKGKAFVAAFMPVLLVIMFFVLLISLLFIYFGGGF